MAELVFNMQQPAIAEVFLPRWDGPWSVAQMKDVLVRQLQSKRLSYLHHKNIPCAVYAINQ
jgi:hypothetical protein